jgi:hypothetical protein
MQVGQATVGGVDRASLWEGTAQSWVDLHALLPPGYSSSEARGIWRDGVSTLVVGSAYNSSAMRREAVMWAQATATQTIVATTTSLGSGAVFSGTAANINASDDIYYVLRPGVVLTTAQSPIVLVVSFNLPSASSNMLASVVESRAQQGSIRQTIEALNFSSGTYLQLDQQTLPTTSPDTVVTSAISPTANFIGPGNEVRMRISYKTVGAILVFPWRVLVDEATLRYTP